MKSIYLPTEHRRNQMIFTGGRRNAHVGAFTLVELLTVIGVIALLSAIVLPVLSGARDNARKATCLSNLRQFGMAFAQYVEDYDQIYPLPGSEDQYDLDQEGPYWDLAKTKDGSGTVNAYIAMRSTDRSSGASVWFCPSMPDYYETDTVAPGATVSFKDVTKRTYTMNWYLRDPSPTSSATEVNPDSITNSTPANAPALFRTFGELKNPLNGSRLVAPAQTILLFEGVPVIGENSAGPYFGSSRRSGDFSFEKGDMPTSSGLKDVYAAQGIVTGAWDGRHPWHRGTNNTLFCDGHVAVRKPKAHPWTPSEQDNMWYVTRYR